MKIDHDYIRGLLTAFEDAKEPYTDILELENKGFSHEEDAFLFHMELLFDKGFIESKYEDGDWGHTMDIQGGHHWSVVPLRMTIGGHEFLAAIREPDVWEKIKQNFKTASLETIKTVAIDLAKGYAKKKTKELLGE